MSKYLNEQFYKKCKKEIHQYINNYEYMKERSIIIENQVQTRIIEEEKSYEILKQFGVIL